MVKAPARWKYAIVQAYLVVFMLASDQQWALPANAILLRGMLPIALSKLELSQGAGIRYKIRMVSIAHHFIGDTNVTKYGFLFHGIGSTQHHKAKAAKRKKYKHKLVALGGSLH